MENKKDALSEALQMLQIPMKDLPELAKEFLQHLSNKVGMCIEVCITAYAYYNQAVLNMDCSDNLYKISDEDLKWFKDRI